jgi:pimeloyl-ACP methyl ester carboxylesterase
MASEVRPKDGTISVNGLNLHYLDWGNASAQSMLLLHGFTSHAHTWDLFAPTLCSTYHVVALDQRGHGDSDWAPVYHPDLAVEDIVGVVDQLGLHRMVLIGHSMGGGNALHYTAAHPSEVVKLVVVDIGPETAPGGRERINAGIQQQDEFDSEEQAVQQARLAAPGADVAWLERIRIRTLQNLKQLPNGKWTWKWDKALRDPAKPRAWRSPEEGWTAARTVTCPTLLVRGADSDILAADTAEQMVREMPNCTLVTVAGAGHSIPNQRPAEFESAVRDWLEG